MSTEHRLSEVLTNKLGYYVPVSEIGYETIWLMKDEVDTQLIPKYLLDNLGDPIVADSASYTDANGNYYLLISVETGLPIPYEVCLVNDEIVSDFLDGID
ncbi:hypothetical protein [Ureibacillus acetophenoni]|uniref:Uncharacterized protein n=1 Tax=Ureibacillus acetophenoni TaxID=614649 RepID=A0A285TZ09_9BACL|nr:hypothetical protein [Ureibacillus acetophenoni]SOC34819.1 hypothetical protein SAMN05877842_101112 [Ureibacillus acetophenoni]